MQAKEITAKKTFFELKKIEVHCGMPETFVLPAVLLTDCLWIDKQSCALIRGDTTTKSRMVREAEILLEMGFALHIMHRHKDC